MKLRMLPVVVAGCLLVPALALAAPRVLVPYAHDQSKRIAQDLCDKQANCKSAAITECVRSSRTLVQCIAYTRYSSGIRSYCTYRIGTEYVGQELRFWKSAYVCG
jgi:hypothetical protein